MERVGRRPRRVVAPQLVDQPLGGDDLARTREQQCEERTWPDSTESDPAVSVDDFERPSIRNSIAAPCRRDRSRLRVLRGYGPRWAWAPVPRRRYVEIIFFSTPTPAATARSYSSGTVAESWSAIPVESKTVT